MIAKKSLLPLLLAAAAGAATAGPVAGFSAKPLVSPDVVQTFDAVGAIMPNTLVSGQFAAQGLHFAGTLLANQCGHDYGPYRAVGMAGNYLSTQGPGCGGNATLDWFSMKLDAAVSVASLNVFMLNHSGAERFELYRNGAQVATWLVNEIAYAGVGFGTLVSIDGRTYINRSTQIAGVLTFDGQGQAFDEIRYSESAARPGTRLVIDELRYRQANQVSEPGALAVTALALVGVALSTRRRVST